MLDVATTLDVIRAAATAAGAIGAAMMSLPALVRCLKAFLDMLSVDDPRYDSTFEAWRDAQLLQDDCDEADRARRG